MSLQAAGRSRQAGPTERGPGCDQHQAHPHQHRGESAQEHLPPGREQQHQAEDQLGEQGVYEYNSLDLWVDGLWCQSVEN